MATNFSPCKGSYVLNQFPSNVMFGMNGFHVSASGAIQGHHGPLVFLKHNPFPNKQWILRVCSTHLFKTLWEKEKLIMMSVFYPCGELSAILIKFEFFSCKPLSLKMSKNHRLGKG